MYLFFLLVFPLPSVVHDHVSPWPLQQFFLCCSSPWHCNGIQDITNYPVISDPQWQTGINCHIFSAFLLKEYTGKITSWLNSAALQIDNGIVLSSWSFELGSVGKLANGIYKRKKMGLGCMAVSNCCKQLCHKVAVYNFFKIHLKKGPFETQLLFVRGLFEKLSFLIIRNLFFKKL